MVYVGDLPDSTSDYELRDFFESMALWPVPVWSDRNVVVNQARYGFVKLLSGEQALRAIASLNGASFHGNSLRLFVMS